MKSATKCPTFACIASAVDGEELAIEKIWKHYNAYIAKSSLRPLYDEYGNIYIAVDTELQGRIKTALLDMILKFEIKIA